MADKSSVSFLNICGAMGRKRPLILEHIRVKGVAIMGLVETFLARDSRFNLPFFQEFHRPRRGPRSGGAALLIRKDIPATREEFPATLLPEGNEAIMAQIHVRRKKVLICAIYSRPNAVLPTPLLEHILATGKEFVILGDLNARSQTFRDHRTNAKGRLLERFITDNAIVRLDVPSPTYVGNGFSNPDHALVSAGLGSFTGLVTVDDYITSDHLSITFPFTLTGPPCKHTFTKPNWKKADWKKIDTNIREQTREIQTIRSTEDVDRALGALEGAFKDATKDIPTITIDPSRPPLPPNIVNRIKAKRALYREWIRTRDVGLKVEWNRANAIIRRMIAQHKEKAWEEACSSLDYRDGAKFWNKFKALTGQLRSGRQNLVRDDGTPIANPLEQAEEYRKVLSDVFSPVEDPLFKDKHKMRCEEYMYRIRPQLSPLFDVDHVELGREEDYILQPITEEDFQDARPTKNKAPGDDGITARHVNNAPSSWPLLMEIFNKSLQLGYYPESWKRTTMVMIPKPKKDPSKAVNYRPISLTSTIGKWFERILARRMTTTFEENGVLPQHQYGFRTRRCTADPLALYTSTAAEGINRNKCTAALFLDIERAFDSVWHDGLLYKLAQVPGVSLNLLRIINGFLTSRNARVRVGKSHSNPFPLQAGVPQGTVLSPLLFTLFCWDMPAGDSISKPVTLCQYADDTAIWCVGNTAGSATRHLQLMASKLQQWFRTWRMKPNANKTQLLTTKPMGRRHEDCSISLWGQRVHNAKEATYLGVLIDHNLTFRKHAAQVYARCSRRSNLIRAVRAGGRGVSAKCGLLLYKSFVRPVMEYAALAILPFGKTLKTHASLERRILRQICGLQYDTGSKEVYAISNIEPILHRLCRLRCSAAKRIADFNEELLGDILQTAVGPIPKANKRKLYSTPRFIHDHLHLYYPDLQLPPLDIRPKVRAPEAHTIIPGLPLVPKKRRKKRTAPKDPDPPEGEDDAAAIPVITID
jgi:hypothetical protein